jgi:hypothetical protein
MRIYKANIAQGIGDNIMARCYADQAKHQYDKIYFTHHAPIVKAQKNNSPDYWKFLNDIGKLFFSEPPYIYNEGEHPFRGAEGLISDFNIIPQKPSYKNLLCKGTSLNLNEEYIVLTTKLRYFEKSVFYKLSTKLWSILRELSKKYKIVVLGERVVEMCQDYIDHGANQIYGIYEQIIANLPSDRIIDLTIPALGISSPNLLQIQQDCLIMNEAKFVITLGVGGNFCMAMATSNVVGYRIDNEPIADTIFSKKYSDAIVTKNWDEFINILKGYL